MKLNRFVFIFLGAIDIGIIDIFLNNLLEPIYKCWLELPNCDNLKCSGNKKSFIIPRGYHSIIKINVELANGLECPLCHSIIENIQFLKSIILFRATGQIEFRRGNETETEFKTFELKDDRIAMFEYKNYLKQFVVI